ncbi:MAG: protein phosphatase 2C domain-containing protein [Alphaproteobacteria bacterium]|nr:protein phosphatase 2C domain-containing protein [Alphaproteobacteria bacterium]
MRIEAFTEAKDPARPETNEDRFVVLPGRAYAVIDGVTDRIGARYEGMLAGQYGAHLIKEALEERLGRRGAPVADARDLLGALTDVIADAYRRHGTYEKARVDWNHRFSATLAIALQRPDHLELLLVGDSGIRLGLARDLRLDKDLDLITATVRQQVWKVVAARTEDPVLRETLSRRVTWSGTRQPVEAVTPHLAAIDLMSIEEAAIATACTRFPVVPADEIARLVRGGIINAQGAFQNNADSVLGYSCFDGFPVPLRFAHHERVPLAGLRHVELYTDGYFKAGDGFGIEAWERAFSEVESDDPAKIARYPSVKGTLGAIKADDRTYLGVAL